MSVSYFLGANSAEGFYSLYDELKDRGKCYLNVIKGGPGTGKSTFMRRVGESLADKGYEAEFVRCSGDASSIDAIYFPELHTAFTDGTAPHTMEPEQFGVNGEYIDLGRFSSTPFSKEDREKLARLNGEYKRLYGYAYELIAAAGNAAQNEESGSQDSESVKEQLAEIIGSAPQDGGGTGKIKRRFIRAVCHDGLITDLSSLDGLNTIYSVDTETCAVEGVLEYAAAECCGRGLDVIKCLSPLSLSCEAVLIPEMSMGCISSEIKIKKYAKLIEGKGGHDITRTKKSGSCERALLEQACRILRDASKIHAAEEEIGKQYMDFEALDRFTEKYIKIYYGKLK